MDEYELIKSVHSMIEKAARTMDANDALKFSQAALNAANAMCSLKHAKYETECSQVMKHPSPG